MVSYKTQKARPFAPNFENCVGSISSPKGPLAKWRPLFLSKLWKRLLLYQLFFGTLNGTFCFKAYLICLLSHLDKYIITSVQT